MLAMLIYQGRFYEVMAGWVAVVSVNRERITAQSRFAEYRQRYDILEILKVFL
jgi:hypothetical protein